MKAKNWMVFVFVLLSLFVSVGAFAQDAAEETAATETEAAAAETPRGCGAAPGRLRRGGAPSKGPRQRRPGGPM